MLLVFVVCEVKFDPICKCLWVYDFLSSGSILKQFRHSFLSISVSRSLSRSPFSSEVTQWSASQCPFHHIFSKILNLLPQLCLSLLSLLSHDHFSVAPLPTPAPSLYWKWQYAMTLWAPCCHFEISLCALLSFSVLFSGILGHGTGRQIVLCFFGHISTHPHTYTI